LTRNKKLEYVVIGRKKRCQWVFTGAAGPGYREKRGKGETSARKED